MPVKTKKDLQSENSELKEKLNMVTNNINPFKQTSNWKKIFKCEECETEYIEEWKLRAHEKKHKKYQCDQCAKSLDYLHIKKKQIIRSHEKTKL
jgi:hypothetical protein